jgi:CHAT domain-containing protein/tetratricopeptide (TPR) repeat protein
MAVLKARASLVVVSGALLLGACAPQVTIEEARPITAEFQGELFTPPPRTVTDLVRALDALGPNPELLAVWQAAASAQPPAGTDAPALAAFYLKRSHVAGQIGRVEQQLDDVRAAAKHAADARLSYREFRDILRALAFAEAAAGNFNSAIDALRRAIAIQTGSIASNEIAARLSARVGDLPSARTFETVVAGASWSLYRTDPFKRWDDPFERWRIPLAKVWVRHGEGRWREAEAEIREALRLMDAPEPRERSATPRERVLVERTLAENLLEQRRLAEAETLARGALRRAIEEYGKFDRFTLESLNLIVKVLAAEDRLGDAEHLARVTLATVESLGLPRGSLTLAGAYHSLGTVLTARRQWPEAAAAFERARTAVVAGDPELYQRIYGRALDEPLALALASRPLDAIQQLTTALAHRSRHLSANHPDTLETRGILAVARKRAGDTQGALEDFRLAVPRLLPRAAEHRIRVIFEEYVDLLSRVGGPNAAAESLRLAEAGRGGAVQQALVAATTRAAARDARLADLVRREQDARAQLAVLHARLAEYASAREAEQPAELVRAVRTRLAELGAAQEALEREITRGFPDYAGLMNPQPPTPEEIQRHLRSDEALVVLHAGAERTLVWAVPARGPVAFAVVEVPARDLAEPVARLRRALDTNVTTFGEIPPFDTVTAHRLYAALLRPVEEAWLGATSLLVVPDGALAQVPFSLLVTEQHEVAPEREGEALFAPYARVPWLARRVAVTQLPSVASLVALRAVPTAGTARRPFAGFGDPWFAAPPLVATPPPDALAPIATLGLTSTRRSAPRTRTAASAGLGLLPRLPDTAEEVRRVAAILQADPESDVFLGPRANEHVVRTTDLSDRRVLMFATHGLVPGDLDGLTEPALALSAPAVTGLPGDGLLTMGEILGLRLNADWVVLSACNTAAGEGAGAEAVSGLGRAFFYAGSRAVLVSNWPVETTSALTLTIDLFQRYAGTTITRAQALREAMLALIDGPGLVRDGRTVVRYAHPIFWAPFSLVGDGGGP